MSTTRAVSLLLLVGGIIVLTIAYQQSGSFADSTKHFFTGNYRDGTTWEIVIGAIACALGFVGLVVPVGRVQH